MTGKVIKVGEVKYFEAIENGSKIIYPIKSSNVYLLENKYYNFIYDINENGSTKAVIITSLADDIGKKESNNKLVYDIDFDFIIMMAGRMQRNRGKYPVGNWKKKIDVEQLKQALFRHTMEIMQGNYDDEQCYGHLIAVACNAFMITYQLKERHKID